MYLPSLILLMLACVLSGIAPHDRLTWWMEIAPILIVVPVLIQSRRSFPLTGLLYGLIAVHGVILAVGGHWTYAEVPAGRWIQEWLQTSRNDYDKFGHFAQGFVPVIALREILLRCGWPVRGGLGVAVLVLAILGISATYELIEWQAAVGLGQGADAFLGSQGDVWDTQKDMACAGIGAVLALLGLARLHDRQLATQTLASRTHANAWK